MIVSREYREGSFFYCTVSSVGKVEMGHRGQSARSDCEQA